jgi:hypothetical protein
VGKSGIESLWRLRGASVLNTNQSASPGEHAHHPRRARRSSMVGTRVLTVAGHEAQDGGSQEPESAETPESPEIHDEPGPAPELDDSGNPEPDVPEPEIPEPEIPEPEIPEPAKPPVPETPRVE